MVDSVGIKVAKWTKLTDGSETDTAQVVERTDGIKALAVQNIESGAVSGSTLQSSGSVDTLGIAFPNPAVGNISEFLIQCPEDQEIDHKLLVSTNGVDFMTLHPSGHLGWSPKGPITQLTIKANTNAGVLYELILNVEA